MTRQINLLFLAILAAFCGFFVAAEKANAQVAQVFAPSSGNLEIATPIPGVLFQLDFSKTADEIFAEQERQAVAKGIPSGDWAPGFAIVVSETGERLAGSTINDDGRPCASATPGVCSITLQLGNIVEITDLNIGVVLTLATVRVYENADGEWAFAFGQDAQTLAQSISADGEFFLNSATYSPTSGVGLREGDAGYVGYVECGGETPNGQAPCFLNFCDEDQALVDGVCTALDCVGDQTIADNMCIDPTDCTDGQTVVEGVCTDPICGDGQTVVAGVCTDSAEDAAEDTAKDGLSRTQKVASYYFGGVGVGAALFFAALAFSDDEDDYEFSPSFGYSINESGYSANVGGRIDFRKGDWSAYWSAGQTNANGAFGDFRYASGGEYKTDFWQAAFSESVQGETADYDLSLSADLSGGVWSLSPVYRMHSRLEEGESETRNSLNLEGILEWNRWTIRPSAGFQWRRTNEFGDNARFRVWAVREF